MAEGPRAPLLRAVPGDPTGETVPPVSKSQPVSEHEQALHESVTLAPPAPDFSRLWSDPVLGPAPAEHRDDPFRAALEAGTRAGLGLGELSQMLEELSRGVTGAKRANVQLVQELSTLHVRLSSEAKQQLRLEQRIAELEQQLAKVRADAERERQFVTDQHDDFLAGLLDEHEHALQALRAARAQEETARAAGEAAELALKLAQAQAGRQQLEFECQRACEALVELQRQLDAAQARANARERERDELRAEASTLRARLGTPHPSTTPPARAPSRPPTFRPPPALELDQSELEAFPRVDTRPGVGGPNPSEPPAARPQSAPTVRPPRPRLISAASIPPSQIPRQPVLKQKPDAASRPLIGYSLGEEHVQSETLEGARISSTPPRK